MPIRVLPKELQEKAKNELNEVPSRLQDDVDHIKEWILKQPYLQINIDEQLVVSFLRSCKFSLQQVKEKLDVYYSMRAILPEYFDNRNPFLPEIQEFFNSSMFVVLPETKNPLDPRRFLINTRNTENVSISTFMKGTLMAIDILTIEDDGFVINGQEVIVDFQNVPYNYIKQLTPRILKIMVLLIQSAYAARFRGIYFINTPTFLQTIVGIFKSFLSEKIRSRVHVYSADNIKALHDVIPLSIFPQEYGGCTGPLNKLSHELKLKVESYKQWFKEDSKNRSDESKRDVTAKYSLELRNMEGSFRQLEID